MGGAWQQWGFQFAKETSSRNRKHVLRVRGRERMGSELVGKKGLLLLMWPQSQRFFRQTFDPNGLRFFLG